MLRRNRYEVTYQLEPEDVDIHLVEFFDISEIYWCFIILIEKYGKIFICSGNTTSVVNILEIIFRGAINVYVKKFLLYIISGTLWDQRGDWW